MNTGASAIPSLDKGKLTPNDCAIFHRGLHLQPHLEKKCHRKWQTGNFGQKLHEIAIWVMQGYFHSVHMTVFFTQSKESEDNTMAAMAVS